MSAAWSLKIPIQKVNASRGLITGWAALSVDANGNHVIDYDNQHIPLVELEKAVHAAFSQRGGSGAVGDMHSRKGVADLVGSMVFDKQKISDVFGPEAASGSPAGWLVDVQVNDRELLADVETGRKMELSIKGSAETIPYTNYAKSKGFAKSSGPETLINLELDDAELLSIVDQGASGNATSKPAIVLVKRKKDIMGAIKKALGIGSKPVTKADESMAGASLNEQIEALLADVPEATANALRLVFSMLQEKAGAEAPKAPPPPKPDAEPPKAEDETMKPDEIAKALTSLDPEVRAIVQKSLTTAQDAQTALVEVTKVLDTEVSKRRDREAIEKANKTPHVPGEVTELAALLSEAEEKMSPEGVAALSKMLESVDGIVAKSGVLDEHGSSGEGGPSDPEKKIHEMAKRHLAEVRKSRGGSKMTFEQAVDEMWQQNPDIHDEYNTIRQEAM